MRVTRENLNASKAFVDFWEDHEVVGHEAHYHQRLFLEAWMSVKDPNAGNDHMVFPEVYKCLARI